MFDFIVFCHDYTSSSKQSKQSKRKYNGYIGLRADDKTREILQKFKEKIGVGFSEMIRSVFFTSILTS